MEARVREALDGQSGHVGVEISDLGTRIAVTLGSVALGMSGRYRQSRFERPPAPDALVEQIGALIEQTRDAGSLTITQVGVALWGQVNPISGEIDDAHYGADWAGYPLSKRLAARVGVPVRIATGAHAAARAEALAGAGEGRSPLLFIHLGRVVTSALVIEGVPLMGDHFREGRLGHWQTGMDSPRCVCGAHGHLEPLISAQSLIRLAIGAAADDDDALRAIHRVTGGRAESLTAPQLVTLASEGVRPLREVVDYAVEALAGALANLIVTLDLAVIIIGGPLAQGDEVFFVWLRERVATHLIGVSEPPAIVPATLGARGALTGALLL